MSHHHRHIELKLEPPAQDVVQAQVMGVRAD